MKVNLRDYENLVKKIAFQYRSSTIPIEDLIQEGMIGLIEAEKRYDEEKGTFGTYSSYWIKKFILKAIEEDKKQSFEAVSFDDAIRTESADTQESKIHVETTLKLPKGLPEVEEQVLRLFFEQEYNLKEISDQLDISRERVRQVKQKALRRLKSMNFDVELMKKKEEN